MSSSGCLRQLSNCFQAVVFRPSSPLLKRLPKPFLSGLSAVASWWSRSECASEHELSRLVSEWVSEWNNRILILTNVIVSFGVSHWFDIRIRYEFDTQLSSHLLNFLWFLAYNHLHIIFTDFTVLAVTLRKTAEDVNHLKIDSGLHAIKKSVFLLEIGAIGASWNRASFFCEERAFYRFNQMPRSEDIIFQFLPWHY